MFPVPRLAEQLQQEWATELASHFGITVEQFRTNPTRVMDYPGGFLRIELMDGSFAEFNCAFYLVSEEKRAIAVFTEHSGHHLYPYHEARVLRNGKVLYTPEHA